MAILDGDIQLLKSETLDDVSEGGGRATGIAVVDGASNNLFSDISELDRTYGRISLRKVFPAVVTDNTDTYFGAHAIVATPPADPKVSVTLFTTKSWTDTRADAQNKLESYLSASAESRWTLYGNHLAGQHSVQMHAPHAAIIPSVDSVLMLVSRTDATKYQYVRVSRIIAHDENVSFEDTRGAFVRDLVTVEISDALRFPFAAAAMERYTGDWYAPPTKVHTTIAADAAAYYGVQPLKIAASLGDLTIKAQSIYTQLVPSALSETPIIDARCAADRSLIVPITGASTLTFQSVLSMAAGVAAVRYFGSSVARGTVTVSVGGVTLSDDSTGTLVPKSGYTGTVDYETGAVAVTSSTAVSNSTFTFTAQQACSVAQSGNTSSTKITVLNRGYTYVKALSPVPAPGSVSISYRAQAKWYSLYDDGTGGLRSDDSAGVGTVNYATGSVVLTLGALPDADTEIMFSWGTPVHYESHVGSTLFDLPSVNVTIPGGTLEPSSLTITYAAGGVTKTVTDSNGVLSGDATGYVNYASGEIVLTPSSLPDAGGNITIKYKTGTPDSHIAAATGATTTFSVGKSVKPGTLSVAFVDTVGGNFVLTDNGSGALSVHKIDLSGVAQSSTTQNALVFWGATTRDGKSVALANTAGIYGTINYATGEITLAALASYIATTYAMSMVGSTTQTSSWQSVSGNATATGSILCNFRVGTDNAGGEQTHVSALPSVELRIMPTTSNSLVPGSLRFSFAGGTFVDRNGVLYKDVNPATNSGVAAGTVDYSSGKVSLSNYTGGGTAAITVAALTRKGVWVSTEVTFRTAGAPIQQSSLYISAVSAETSGEISGAADSTGIVSGSLIKGTVDVTTGIAGIRFGSMVTAAGHESEWWYHPDNVVAGQIFKPTMVYPDTIKYNAVAVTSLPLSSDVLGLDPVRLPVDGRVPIFRKGDVVVVHHTATTAPQTVTNSQTVNLGRVRLAKVRVIGANGTTIQSGYTQDLDAGTVTFNNVSGYSQPVTIEHRIEDMALVSDTQINGELRITRALTHDFPLGSFVSSALIIGDSHARVSVLFDQATWTGWYDTVQGNTATGTFNKVQFPPEVTNRGAIQERWEIVFTNSTTVNVIGESVGQVLTAVPITSTIAPINPATGTPYFSINALGWGAGWATGNVLRFNTVAANYPVWCARTTLQGNATVGNDSFSIGIRGDIDA